MLTTYNIIQSCWLLGPLSEIHSNVILSLNALFTMDGVIVTLSIGGHYIVKEGRS